MRNVDLISCLVCARCLGSRGPKCRKGDRADGRWFSREFWFMICTSLILFLARRWSSPRS